MAKVHLLKKDTITETHTRTTPHMIALFATISVWFSCKERLYNYMDKLCMTVDECSSINENTHAYKAIGRCIQANFYGDNKPIEQKDGSYECEEGFYLKFEY